MAYKDMAHSHVQRLLREGLELEEVVQDCDGDYALRQGNASYYVSVSNRGHMVKIWSHATYGLKRSKQVLREVNETNEHLMYSRAFLRDGHLMIEAILPISVLSAWFLGSVCREVGSTADQVGQLFATVHGGILCSAGEIESAG